MAHPHCCSRWHYGDKDQSGSKFSNVPQRSCLGLPKPVDGSKPATRNIPNDPGSKDTSDASFAVNTDGVRGPRQSSDRSSQSTSPQLPSSTNSTSPKATVSTTRSRSPYPASTIGTAMVARGEMGFLIAALAENIGIFASQNDSVAREDSSLDIYLVVTWAVVLCTVIGPVSVELLVRRVKKLQRQDGDGGRRFLGNIGVYYDFRQLHFKTIPLYANCRGSTPSRFYTRIPHGQSPDGLRSTGIRPLQ